MCFQDVSTACMVLVATDTQSEESENKGAKLEPLRLALYLKETTISNMQDPVKVLSAMPSACKWQGTWGSARGRTCIRLSLWMQSAIPCIPGGDGYRML